jgi:putative membrane protein insertion efficiency factor
MIGCGMELMLVAPSAVRQVAVGGTGSRGSRLTDRLIAAVRVYQREISPKRPPCCHFTPTCSAYAVEALERHGAGRGTWLTLRRLVRCRPGGARGADPVPA